MQELEDEPIDVQNATPVEDEVKRGETDLVSAKKTLSKINEPPLRHACRKTMSAMEKRDCCEEKREKLARELRKRVIVHVPGPACKPRKTQIIPRHCMTREEYLDFLAAPSKKCETPCEKKPVLRRVVPIPPRIQELAKPPKRKLMLTLEERAGIMSPEMLEHLVQLIEGETALSPEQAENLVRDKALQRKSRKKKKKKRKPRCEELQEPRKSKAGEPLDLDSAKCQYLMAVRFVRSILAWKCSTPPSEYRDISEVVLEQLAELLEYPPLGDQDRKSRQMRLLANLFACWISGLLMQVAEKRRDELEAECLRRRREAEELAAQAELEIWADAVDEELPDMDLDDDDDDDRSTVKGEVDVEDEEEEGEDRGEGSKAQTAATSFAQSSRGELEEVLADYADEEDEEADASRVESRLVDAVSQYEEADAVLAASESASQALEEASERSEPPEDAASRLEDADEQQEEQEEQEVEEPPPESEGSATLLVEPVDEAQQTESVSRADAQAATEPLSMADAAKSREQLELEKMASRVGEALQTELPFLTFARILDALYAMLECESENRLCDPLTNRLHRAVYEKLLAVVQLEAETANERTKDAVDVVSGKIALWLRRLLDEQQLRFLDAHPAEVESRELRDWSRWVSGVAAMAEDWSGWIGQVSREAEHMRRARPTRQTWQNWTRDFESNALLWRRAYLEALHRQHRNAMLMSERKVRKTTPARPSRLSEVAVNDTDLDAPEA